MKRDGNPRAICRCPGLVLVYSDAPVGSLIGFLGVRAREPAVLCRGSHGYRDFCLPGTVGQVSGAFRRLLTGLGAIPRADFCLDGLCDR